MEIEKKRVAVYCRVSTREQTVENQVLDLERYAAARKWTIVGKYVDEGVSGAKDNRPALKEVMDVARKRKIDVLLVWRFDRFARSLNHLVNSLNELRDIGVDFVSYQEAVDTSTAQGRLMLGVMGSLAEFERELIRERIFAGLRRAKAHGKQFGRPLLELDASRAQKLRQDGRSLRQIASVLKVSTTAVYRVLQNGTQN